MQPDATIGRDRCGRHCHAESCGSGSTSRTSRRFSTSYRCSTPVGAGVPRRSSPPVTTGRRSGCSPTEESTSTRSVPRTAARRRPRCAGSQRERSGSRPSFGATVASRHSRLRLASSRPRRQARRHPVVLHLGLRAREPDRLSPGRLDGPVPGGHRLRRSTVARDSETTD